MRTPDEPEETGDGVRVRLDLSYDGADFSGWARQPGRRTVQGVLSEALGAVLRIIPEPRLTVAGRTDAGVHARGQVAHVDLPELAWNVHGDALLRRLSGILPEDIRVWGAAVAPDGFDARFAAIGRRYTYRVSDHPYGPDPIRRRDVLWHPRPLDVDAMNAAAAALVGEHDFAAFCRKREGATTIRHLTKLGWVRTGEYELAADVRADAFCHSMVRALVGAMIAVGEGRVPAEFPAEALATRERHPKLTVVAAHGLTLEEVYYPPDEDLAARAIQARQMRTLE